MIETDLLSDHYGFVDFVPKHLKLNDCSNLGKKDLIKIANGVNSVGIDKLPAGALAKIQFVQDRWFNATHPRSNISESEKQAAIEDYHRLCKAVCVFLNTSLEWDIDNNATLFGTPLGQTNLSDGQKILLQFCVAIYSHEQTLKPNFFHG